MKNLFNPIFLAGSTLFMQGTWLYAQEEHPNIIWITCEDISPYMETYGDKVVKTPNIDRLAAEGQQFQSVYTTAGVSSPSRSCIITGMYPMSIGTQHMRTLIGNPAVSKKLGIYPYSAVIPEYVKAFPEYLRMNGYYTSNNQKTDYQFIEPVTVWDECSPAATYQRAPKGKPFFSVFNLFITHESQLFKQSPWYKEHEDLLVKPEDVTLPPYYKDTPEARKCMARMLSNVQLMDYQVGEIIKQLKKDGVYDNAYIFFFSDHGGTMPWMKREILERGTHIPFIVKFPKGKNAGTVNTDLISSVDFAPTILSLAGIDIPNYIQGQAFLGKQSSSEKRRYVFAARDRMDECYDRVRSVRDKQFRYIYNFMPNQPKYMDVSYRRGLPMMKEMLELHEKGELNEYQDDWFKPTKPLEELYDVENDPDELHNLASDPAYKEKLEELRKAFRTWMNEVGDLSYMPEKEMLANWWHGESHAPLTEAPELHKVEGGYTLSCPTIGASIGYKILKKGEKDEKINVTRKSFDMGYVIRLQPNDVQIQVGTPWNVYQKNTVLKLNPGDTLIVNAKRIGYEENIKTFTF